MVPWVLSILGHGYEDLYFSFPSPQLAFRMLFGS